MAVEEAASETGPAAARGPDARRAAVQAELAAAEMRYRVARLLVRSSGGHVAGAAR